MAAPGKATSGAADGGYSTLYRNYVLVLLTLVYVTNYADRSILSTLTQPIKTEFGLSDAMMGAMGGIAFALFYTTAGLPVAMPVGCISARPPPAIALIKSRFVQRQHRGPISVACCPPSSGRNQQGQGNPRTWHRASLSHERSYARWTLPG